MRLHHVARSGLLTLTSLGWMACGDVGPSSDRDKEDDKSQSSMQASRASEAGEPTDRTPDPAIRPEVAPSETGSVTLLTVREGDRGSCELVQTRLPGKTERVISEAPCEPQSVVLDEDGERAWVGSALIDLTTGTTLDTPEIPKKPNPKHPDLPNLISHAHQFNATGQPVLHATWGFGDGEWYGTPQMPYIWSISEQFVFELADGEWRMVASHRSGEGIPRDDASYATLTGQQESSGQRITHGDLWPESTASLSNVEDAELNTQLHGIAGGDPSEAGWNLGGESPLIAVRWEWMGEYDCSTPPVLVSQGDEWHPLALSYGSHDCIGVHRQGDWLLVVSHQPHSWTVFDLKGLKSVASGDGVTAFWPVQE